MVKILVSGDKKFIAEVASMAKSCGVDVVAGRSLRESIDRYYAEKPGLVLSQERLSDGSAEELMHELKKSTPGLIQIVSLPRRDADSALRWMEAGAYECVYEPIDGRDLCTVVRGAAKTVSNGFSHKDSFWRSLLPTRGWNQKTFAALAAGALLLLGLVWGGQILFQKRGAAKSAVPAELPLSFRLPYQNPTGVAWDGRNLWVCDWSVQTVYKHKLDAGLSLAQFFPMTDVPAVSLAWGEDVLWTVGQDHAVRRHLLDGRLTAASTVKLPGVVPSAIAWDGRNLWSVDAQTRKIYKHANDDQLTVAATYQFPGKNPVGMAWVGSDLWVADEETGRLYRLRYDNEVFTLVGNPQPGVHLPGTNRLSGLAFDGRNLWTVSEGNGLIFRHPLADLKGD